MMNAVTRTDNERTGKGKEKENNETKENKIEKCIPGRSMNLLCAPPGKKKERENPRSG